MQKYTNVVQDNAGNTLANVAVTVYLTGTQTLATLYSNNAGLSKVNPFTNDTDGSVEFFAGNGRYDIVYTKSGYTFDDASSAEILFEDVGVAGIPIVSPVLSGTVTGTYTLGGTPTVSAGLVLATGSTTARSLATRFDEYVNVKDYGAVGDNATSDQTAVVAAIADAYAAGKSVYWPVGTYVTTATIANFHDVRHRGKGIVKRGSGLFYVDPALWTVPAVAPSVTNHLYLSTTGDNLNDGLGTSEPRLTVLSTGSIIYGYSYGNITWQVNLAAGTYDTTGNFFYTEFPCPNRVVFAGPSVSAGVEPTAHLRGSGSAVEIGLYFQNKVRAQVSNIRFSRFRTGASPSSNLLASGIAADGRCDLYTVNVWTDDCDQGIYIANGTQARIQAGRHGYNAINGNGVQFIRHASGSIGYNGSAADVTGATGTAFIGGSYGIILQEFSMAHADYCYFDTQTNAGIICNHSRIHTVSSTFDTNPVGVDGRFNSNLGITDPTFTACTNDVYCRSGSLLAGADIVENEALFLTAPSRENDAVLSSNATASPVTAYSRVVLQKEFQNRGSGFDLEIMHSVTNTNDTKNVTVAFGGVTLLSATIDATTLSTFISVKMRTVNADSALHVISEIRQNGVVPAIVYTSVTTIDMTTADRTLEVTHQVVNTSDTSHVRNVDFFSYH